MKVVVAGASGVVGGRCATILAERGHDLVLISRDPARIAGLPGVPLQLDLGQLIDGTATVLPEADVLVNCAGPSVRWTHPVALAALRAGMDFTDPGGDLEEVHRLATVAESEGHTAVLGAGVQPGLVAIAVQAVVLRTGACRVRGSCGGLQTLSISSVEDYVAAAGTSQEAAGRSTRAVWNEPPLPKRDHCPAGIRRRPPGISISIKKCSALPNGSAARISPGST